MLLSIGVMDNFKKCLFQVTLPKLHELENTIVWYDDSWALDPIIASETPENLRMFLLSKVGIFGNVLFSSFCRSMEISTCSKFNFFHTNVFLNVNIHGVIIGNALAVTVVICDRTGTMHSFFSWICNMRWISFQ
jgi:hypothetical protein